MKLVFIGTGNAFTVGQHNFHSNFFLEKNKKRLLIDCGSDVRHGLHELGLSYKDFSSVYISHLHADHVGGLEWFGFSHYFHRASKKPELFIADSIAESLWNNVLSGGLTSIKGAKGTLSTFFKVHKIRENSFFKWNGVVLHLIPTFHVISKDYVLMSFGLFFEVNKCKIFITTDSMFCPEWLKKYYEEADLIFHDCETGCDKSGVHAHFDDLKKLDPSIKAKMWLYHYGEKNDTLAKKNGFKGFVKKGQIFDLSKIKKINRLAN